MKKLDEVQNYLENKREIFKTIVFAIREATNNDSTKILIKGLKIMDEEEVDTAARPPNNERSDVVIVNGVLSNHSRGSSI